MGKHLNLSQRIIIESKLNDQLSLRKIGKFIGKPHTTISREILNRRILVKGNHFNNFNTKCEKTDKAPFVCNGCPNKNKCKKNHYFYYAKDANDDYKKILVESRQGIDFENVEFRKMDKIVKEEIDKGHSFYMIITDHPEFNITERTLYYYQENGYLSCKSIDLPRKVRYRKRNVPKKKSDRKEENCRINRTYQDFLKYKEINKITYYVEMDIVEGVKGHSVLLTLNFVPFNFMIAFKLESQTISEVTKIFNNLKELLGYELFHKIFPLILTDNGKEFKRPDLTEDNGHDVWKFLDKVFVYRHHSHFLYDVKLTEKQFNVNITVSKSKDVSDPWLIVTNGDPRRAIKDYGYRFGAIETVFKNQKSNGFHLEKTVNASLKYFESMYCIACVGILFLTIIGVDYSKNTKCYKKTKIETHKKIKGKKVRVLSLFNTGLTSFKLAFNSSVYIRIPFNFILYDI